ncbi:Salicylate carboxymethyltransferase [Capsicum chinense]|nr:Salicylate carboxymethyltransferase [Capsicum chinense]
MKVVEVLHMNGGNGDISYANNSLVQGLIEEQKLDAFNIPQYTPSPAEVKYTVEKENSFTINRLEATRVHWNASNDHINGGYNVSRCMRAVAEPLLVSQFAEKIEARYIVDGNAISLLICNEIGVRLYIEIKKSELDFGMYALIITREDKSASEKLFDDKVGVVMCLEYPSEKVVELIAYKSKVFAPMLLFDMKGNKIITDFKNSKVKVGQIYKDKCTLISVMAKNDDAMIFGSNIRHFQVVSHCSNHNTNIKHVATLANTDCSMGPSMNKYSFLCPDSGTLPGGTYCPQGALHRPESLLIPRHMLSRFPAATVVAPGMLIPSTPGNATAVAVEAIVALETASRAAASC